MIPRTAPKIFKNNQKNNQENYQKSVKTIKKTITNLSKSLKTQWFFNIFNKKPRTPMVFFDFQV